MGSQWGVNRSVSQVHVMGDRRDHLVAEADLSAWYDDMRGLPRPTLVALMKLGGKVARLLPRRNQSGS